MLQSSVFLLVLATSAEIIKFFNNHHRARAIFDEMRKTDPTVLRLKVAVATRWYSQYASMKSVLDAKFIIAKICEEKADELEEISDKATAIIAKVVSSAFWTKLATAAKLIEYPTKIIGKPRFQKIHILFMH